MAAIDSGSPAIRPPDTDPAWSPDAMKIAFSTQRDGIYVMDADWSEPVNLTRRAGSDLFPSWSPATTPD